MAQEKRLRRAAGDAFDAMQNGRCAPPDSPAQEAPGTAPPKLDAGRLRLYLRLLERIGYIHINVLVVLELAFVAEAIVIVT